MDRRDPVRPLVRRWAQASGAHRPVPVPRSPRPRVLRPPPGGVDEQHRRPAAHRSGTQPARQGPDRSHRRTRHPQRGLPHRLGPTQRAPALHRPQAPPPSRRRRAHPRRVLAARRSRRHPRADPVLPHAGHQRVAMGRAPDPGRRPGSGAARTLPGSFTSTEGASGQDLDVPVGSVHADQLPVPDQPGGLLHADDGRQAVLAGDHRAMGHQTAHLRDQARDADEQR